MRIILISNFLFFTLLIACHNPNPNLDEKGQDELMVLEMKGKISDNQQKYKDVIYIPIYSDIYIDQLNQNSLLAATLSIRNTSFSDSIYISKIDYYNTTGELVKSYIDNFISLKPMATVNYVIQKEDISGGQGANFIVELSSESTNVRPLIQAIMIGENGNKGFAFSTDGYSIK
mgnify:CR=1 FL=1